MTSVITRYVCIAAVMLTVSIQGRAQDRPAAGTPASGAQSDPRVGLKAGLRGAGEVARNLELVATMPKPEGFFDPKAPAGEPTPPERNAPNGSDTAGEPESSPTARRRQRQDSPRALRRSGPV